MSSTRSITSGLRKLHMKPKKVLWSLSLNCVTTISRSRFRYFLSRKFISLDQIIGLLPVSRAHASLFDEVLGAAALYPSLCAVTRSAGLLDATYVLFLTQACQESHFARGRELFSMHYSQWCSFGIERSGTVVQESLKKGAGPSRLDCHRD